MDLEAYGDQFRQAREARELSLDDVERLTKIRVKHLAAIEQGDFSNMPSAVQLRGFIRNYARALELDEQVMLVQYEEAMRGGRRRWRRKKKKSPPAAPPPASPFASPDARSTQVAPAYQPSTTSTHSAVRETGSTPSPFVQSRRSNTGLRMVIAFFIAAIFTGAVIFGILWVVDDITSGGDDPATEAPRVLDSGEGDMDGMDSAEVRPPLAQLTPTPTATYTPPGTQPPLGAVDDLFVEGQAIYRVWVEITVDGALQYSGHLAPGEQFAYPVNDAITIRTTNADRLNVLVNGQSYSLGPPNQEVVQTISLEGLLTPTPEVPSSPSGDPSPTSTQQAAALSITATPTSTASLQPAASDAATDTTVLLATFTPISNSDGAIASPTSLPRPGGNPTATTALPASPTSLATLPGATTTPTAAVPTATLSPTVAATLTPTNFLPPRFTRTPLPDK
jgi:transcriptional regulator with XRE-family HTH domain